MNINSVIIRPILTEKTTQLAQKQVYAFSVHPAATKYQIKHVIQTIYPVTVSGIRIVNRKGKVRRAGNKQKPKKTSGKTIAYVAVTKGIIDVFPKS